MKKISHLFVRLCIFILIAILVFFIISKTEGFKAKGFWWFLGQFLIYFFIGIALYFLLNHKLRENRKKKSRSHKAK